MRVRPIRALTALARWPQQSQEVARRNAMLASTALLDRRREHVEVQSFITDQLAGRASVDVG